MILSSEVLQRVVSRPRWSQEPQSVPPQMGNAIVLGRCLSDFLIGRYKKKALRISDSFFKRGDVNEGEVSLVVLSCKRLEMLKGLVESLTEYKSKEVYTRLKTILVDNGSGEELLDYCRKSKVFDRIVTHRENMGMAYALNEIYREIESEYIWLIEDDMVIMKRMPVLDYLVEIFREFPEVGVIRLKDQNNWWKRRRLIGYARATSSGFSFYTWFPSLLTRRFNVWACGSVIFRKCAFMHCGNLDISQGGREQANLVENSYAKRFNKNWLAAKPISLWPVFQGNTNEESPGFNDSIDIEGKNA